MKEERGTMKEKTETRIQESEEKRGSCLRLTPVFCFLFPAFDFIIHRSYFIVLC